MPLSDHEKRLLAEMEEALAADDPRLLSTFEGKAPHRSSVLLGFGLILLGIVVLFAGLITKLPPLGIFGFSLSLLGAVLAISNLGRLSSVKGVTQGSGKRGSKGKWSARFEERWDKRNLD